jgi:excisionase family DNA binding protein
MPKARPLRFLNIPQVAEELATSEAQINALLKRGDLPAMKLGARGQWRIEQAKLEEFIARAYEETELGR